MFMVTAPDAVKSGPRDVMKLGPGSAFSSSVRSPVQENVFRRMMPLTRSTRVRLVRCRLATSAARPDGS